MTDFERALEVVLHKMIEPIRLELLNVSHRVEAIEEIKTAVIRLQTDVSNLSENICGISAGAKYKASEFGCRTCNEVTKLGSNLQTIDCTNSNFDNRPGCGLQSTSGHRENGDYHHPLDDSCSERYDRRHSDEIERDHFDSLLLQQHPPAKNRTRMRSLDVVLDEHSSARRARLLALRKRYEQEMEGVVSLKTLLHKLGRCQLGSLARDFGKAALGVRERNTALGIEGSRLIEPTSPFHASFEIVSAIMLVYSAFMVPVQLTFWNVDDPCWVYPTIYFDMFLDVFFLFETFYSLFVGIIDNKGNYEDGFARVLTINLTTPGRFWFNLCTSAPVSWLDWHVFQLCGNGGGASFGFNAGLLRVAKPLRLIKLARLLKSSKAYVMILDALDINPILPRIFKIFCVLAVSMHICTCLFWVVKKSVPEDLPSWLADRDLDEQDKAGCYLVCIYCICTVFTTVGFGDIYAINGSERVFFIFLELTAACLFGTLLGELQEVFASINKNSRQLEAHMEGVISFLNMNRMPTGLKAKVKSYVRFKFIHDQSDEKVQHILNIIPPSLRDEIATTLNTGIFSKVRLFRRIDDPTDRDQFVSALLPCLRTETCSRGTIIARSREPANRIVIISAGRLTMSLPENLELARPTGGIVPSVLGRDERSIDNLVGGRIGRRNGGTSADKRHLLALKAGDSFGDASVLGDERWASAWGIDADFQAMEDSHISYIYTRDVLMLLRDQPRFAHIRKRFLAIARSVASNDQGITEKKARMVFRWSLIIQLVMRARANDFADFASSMSRASHGLGGSALPLAHDRSNSWTLTSRLLRKRSSSTHTNNSPSRRVPQQSVSPERPFTTPLANGKREPQLGINGHTSIGGTPGASAELGTLESGTGTFQSLGGSNSSPR